MGTHLHSPCGSLMRIFHPIPLEKPENGLNTQDAKCLQITPGNGTICHNIPADYIEGN